MIHHNLYSERHEVFGVTVVQKITVTTIKEGGERTNENNG
jgi:hypothetical protein